MLKVVVIIRVQYLKMDIYTLGEELTVVNLVFLKLT